jgi:N-acetylglutamate synthase
VNLSRTDPPRATSVFDLRPMTVADIPDALALWDGMPGLSLFPSDSVEGITGYLDRNPGLSVVLRVGGRLVGAALAGHDGRRGFLHHVAVAPDYRRRGLGRAMVEWCLGRLVAAGIGRCLIFVNAGNEDAKAFWRRVGWDDRPVEVMGITMDPERT